MLLFYFIILYHIICKDVSVKMPQRGPHRSQMHSSSDDSSIPNSNPDSPNAHEAQSRATHARSAQSRAAHTRVEARQGITPCPAHTREAPAGSHRGHRKHVSSVSSYALRAPACSSSDAMAKREYPNRVYNKGVHYSWSPTARDWCTPV